MQSQTYYSDKFMKETFYIRNYQKHMDMRLSMPKRKDGKSKSPTNFLRMVRNTILDPVEDTKERERSGERIDMSNYKKYA